jgi:GAF domain-containing protein
MAPPYRKAIPMSLDARSEALTSLTQFLVTDAPIGDILLQVANTTVEALPGAEMAGITMGGDDGKPTTGVFTDEESPEIDAAQYSSNNGPCLDAWRTKAVVRVDDMTTAAERYPEFSKASRAHGVLSTLSLPLVAGERGVGALNLYARTKDAFSAEDEQLGLELASTAAVVLSNASAYWSAYELSQNLSEAMKSRATIEQAKGMLMARSENLTPDEAFDLLRKASQRENVKLREIAQRLVSREQPPLSTDG